MSVHYNNVAQAVSGTPGTGTITLASAVTGAQTLGAAAGGNATVDVFITDGSAWEVARNCTYTHSGTTLTRGTLEASSTGSAISLTSSAVVRVALSATGGNDLVRLMQMVTPGGRITTESGVPVSTSDRTAQSTIYYTPYTHNGIVLWDGSDWRPITFAETSLALSGLTASRPYDVFAYLSSGALAIEILAWTNDTTRATAVTLQDGRYCKSGDKTRLLLGTIYTTSTTTTEDSKGGSSSGVGGKRYVSNAYNQVQHDIAVIDTTDNWSYTTDTWRIARGQTAPTNCVEFVNTLPATIDAQAIGSAYTYSNSARPARVGVGIDTGSSASGLVAPGYNSGSTPFEFSLSGMFSGRVAAGRHYVSWLEKGTDGTCLFLGDNGETGGTQCGMQVKVWG